ncbi:MAG: N-acetylmuramoyl-L-alanine amidase [Lachnospiraceae bacterium]|nr:N-acetylmuramoyl-L-alanine amidase [Lachnospiraceae bacterium]
MARWKKIAVYACILVCGVGMVSCGRKKAEESKQKDTAVATVSEAPAVFEEGGETFTQTEEYVYTTTELNVRKECSTDGDAIRMLPSGAKVLRIGSGENWSKIHLNEGDFYVASEYVTDKKPKENKGVIYVDPAHQAKENEEQEAIGPDAKDTKKKCAKGAVGVSTKQKESALNLAVAKRLQTELQARGYEVLLSRESEDVNLSTKERTHEAKEQGADLLIHIHANSSNLPQTSGIMTICGKKDSPYVSDLYEKSHALSKALGDGLAKETEASNKGIWETNLMSGINWSEVPVSIVQIGYLSNAEEDEKLATEDYQNKIALGLADGVEEYYGQ